MTDGENKNKDSLQLLVTMWKRSHDKLGDYPWLHFVDPCNELKMTLMTLVMDGDYVPYDNLSDELMT